MRSGNRVRRIGSGRVRTSGRIGWSLALLALLGGGCADGDDDDATDADDDGTTAADDDDSGDGRWRSALYPKNWTPGLADAEGRRLHDFSYAGYRRGEVPLPEAPPTGADVLDFGADPTGVADSTAAIQGAIDSVDEGAVLIPAGTYRCEGLLRVERSRVVLRGDGPDRTFLRFTRGSGMSDTGHITFAGALVRGEDVLLTEDAHAFDTELPGLDPGLDVVFGHVITDEFVEEHGMTGTWQAFNGTWQPLYRREVRPDGSLDVPLRGDLLVRDGASWRSEDGYLREVGIQDLSVATEVSWADAWSNDRSHAIRFSQVADGWIRNVRSYLPDDPMDDRGRHLQSGGIIVVDSKRVTVADCELGPSQNRGGGGNGYLFEISRSNDVLVRDCVGTGGRHNFIQNWGFGTNGCVWLRTHSTGGTANLNDSELFSSIGFSEFHHSLATANLIDDSVVDDGWGATNRRDWSSGAGHSATENVFWNLRGEGTVRSYQYGWGYVIGTEGVVIETSIAEDGLFAPGEGTEPDDWVEGADVGALLDPPSLYEDQLARRIGR
jgi:hypothetical protein